MTPRRGSASAGAGAGCAGQIRRFDRWAAALAELSRVMTPDAILVVADVYPAWKSQPAIGLTRRGRTRSHDELPALVAAGGLRVEHTEPIRSVASVAGAVLVAARTPGCARRCPVGYRRAVHVRSSMWPGR
jgi:hypothetical protein